LVASLERHVAAFLSQHRKYADWAIERVAIAPIINAGLRAELARRGVLGQALADLLLGL
jgi:hypothetical protein